MNSKNFNLVLFFALAYFFTWIATIPLAIKWLPPELHFLGAFGPTIAALVIVAREQRLGDFLQSLTKVFSNRLAWILALSPLLLGLLAYIILYIGGVRIQFQALGLVATIIPVILYGIFEEIGWRGFALKRLQKHFSPLVATFILTLFWACWHIPMFFYRFGFDSAFMVVGFVFSMFFGSLLLTSVYNRSGQVVLSAIIFHICNNIVSINNNDTFLSFYSTLLIVLAVVILIVSKGRLYFSSDKTDISLA